MLNELTQSNHKLNPMQLCNCPALKQMQLCNCPEKDITLRVKVESNIKYHFCNKQNIH